MVKNIPCDCMTCVSLTSNGQKWPLTPNQLRIVRDLCQNPERWQSSTRKQQSSSTFESYAETRVSMVQMKSSVVQVKSKGKSRIETRIQAQIQSSIHFECKRFEQRVVTSPDRNSKSMACNLKAIEPKREMASKHLNKVDSKVKQNEPAVTSKSKSSTDRKQKHAPVLLIKKEKMENERSEQRKPDPAAAAKPKSPIADQSHKHTKLLATIPLIAIKKEPISIEEATGDEDKVSAYLATVPLVTIKKEPIELDESNESVPPNTPTNASSIASIDEISPIKSYSSIEASSCEFKEIANPKSRNASASDTDNIQATSPQSKWAEEVLALLNGGSEKELIKTLSTIGQKTAALIIKCREIHGKYQQIDDLEKMLGWSKKVYTKFLSKNLLD